MSCNNDSIEIYNYNFLIVGLSGVDGLGDDGPSFNVNFGIVSTSFPSFFKIIN